MTPDHAFTTKPEEHPLWSTFVEYAQTQGIALEYEDDWGQWWDCFLAGAHAATKTKAEGD